ncbi:MAG: elongation factor P [Deltaproteobacteria bacterium]|nr:elongation factor P [Deltaproteobacteria bacterium]
MISTAEFRKGVKIELEGEPYLMVDFQHVKPGKGGAFVRTRLKSLVSGRVLERTFRSGERVEVPDREEKTRQCLYRDDEQRCHFMDMDSYDQLFLTEEQLGDRKDYLKEQMVVTALYHNGQPVGIELPNFVELAVAKTDPGVRGDTASGGGKPATLETGAVVQVPLFVNEGDVIRVDTRTGEYVERV